MRACGSTVRNWFQVQAGQTQIVAFTITVPENATPGDHAGIAATVQSVGPSADGNQVSIESRVGFPIMTRVTGELTLAIEPGSVEYHLSWNPFEPGQITARYTIVNDGNVRIQATPRAREPRQVVNRRSRCASHGAASRRASGRQRLSLRRLAGLLRSGTGHYRSNGGDARRRATDCRGRDGDVRRLGRATSRSCWFCSGSPWWFSQSPSADSDRGCV